jgi:hypothetical protein
LRSRHRGASIGPSFLIEPAIPGRSGLGGVFAPDEVVNDGLLLPIDPPGEEQTEERERRRQRVHRASVPQAERRFNTELKENRSGRLSGGARPRPMASVRQ